MEIVHDHKDRYDSLFKLSEGNINSLYDVFTFYRQDKPHYISFLAYKIIRILYLSIRDQSNIEFKKFSTFKDEKHTLFEDIFCKLRKRVVQLTNDNIVVADRQSYSITAQGARQITVDFKLADNDKDGYIDFDEFMLLMAVDLFRGETVSLTITWKEYKDILQDGMLSNNKMFKLINIFNLFILEKMIEHIRPFELEIAKTILRNFEINQIEFCDIKDSSIIIMPDFSNHKLDPDQKFYEFFFKNKKLRFFSNDQDSPNLGMFEYMKEVRSLEPIH